uniref:Uncharacterized protein n=1 Tax=Hucho hucho TaxID=62062 RepID=A0A4W5RCI4_9TELE
MFHCSLFYLLNYQLGEMINTKSLAQTWCWCSVCCRRTRSKRAKKKARDVQGAEEDAPEPVVERKLANEIVRLTNIKASAKIRSTLQVIHTMACEYALRSLFVPGDMQIILGTKSGKIQIFDLASGTLLETVDAHNGALWSLCLSPDQRGIVTGGVSAD